MADQPVGPVEADIAHVTSRILASNALCQDAAGRSLATAFDSAGEAMGPLAGEAAEVWPRAGPPHHPPDAPSQADGLWCYRR